MKKNTTSIFITLFLFFLLTHTSYAKEIYEFHNNARALGLGGSYVTTVNDETALYSNPAALGKLRGLYLTPIDPEVDISGNVGSLLSLESIRKANSVQGLLEILNEHPGQHFYGRAQLSPSVTMPNFGLGALGKYSIDAEVDPSQTNFALHYLSDYAFFMGYNLRFWGGIAKLGFNAKFINRVEVDNDAIPASSTNLNIDNLAAEGGGIGSNVGLLVTLPYRYLPSIGAVVQDVGDTYFNMTNGMFTGASTRPQPLRQKLDAGFSLSPILGRNIRGVITAEMHDILSQDELEKQDIWRRLHAGGEINISDFLFVRGGLNQKYWTAGIEFASYFFQIQLSTYGEDIGSPLASVEERRYVSKFAIRF